MPSALVIVDVQQLLVDELPAQRRVEFLPTIAGLIDRGRATGVPVVYVRHDGGPGDPLSSGSPGWEIATEIAPRAHEPVVDKRFPDAFRETDLAEILAGLAVDRVVVAGMQTEFCIDATIREADRRGYAVVLVEDGHATYAVDGMSERQIRDHVHRVARERVAILPADRLFRDEVHADNGSRMNGFDLAPPSRIGPNPSPNPATRRRES